MVASRAEIERVSGELGAVGNRMFHELFLLLSDPIHRVQFDTHVPHLEAKLGLLRLKLAHAADSYFTAEARVARSLDNLGHIVRDHPWIWNLLPAPVKDQVVIGGAAALAASLVAPGNTGARAVRLFAATQNVEERLAGVGESKVTGSLVSSIRGERPARTLSDLASRVASTNDKKAQIRIERYENGTFVVYLPGTQSGSHNPFDLTTDARLASNAEQSELALAVKRAMTEAGIGKTSPVVLVGYSLGGLLASELSRDGSFNVTGVLTLGSPIGQVPIPSDVSVVSLEHSNDPIPGLTGETNPLTENWVTASRGVKLEALEPALDAHSIENYKETAALADESQEVGMRRVRENLLEPIRGQRLVESLNFEFRR